MEIVKFNYDEKKRVFYACENGEDEGVVFSTDELRQLYLLYDVFMSKELAEFVVKPCVRLDNGEIAGLCGSYLKDIQKYFSRLRSTHGPLAKTYLQSHPNEDIGISKNCICFRKSLDNPTTAVYSLTQEKILNEMPGYVRDIHTLGEDYIWVYDGKRSKIYAMDGTLVKDPQGEISVNYNSFAKNDSKIRIQESGVPQDLSLEDIDDRYKDILSRTRIKDAKELAKDKVQSAIKELAKLGLTDEEIYDIVDNTINHINGTTVD